MKCGIKKNIPKLSNKKGNLHMFHQSLFLRKHRSIGASVALSPLMGPASMWRFNKINCFHYSNDTAVLHKTTK